MPTAYTSARSAAIAASIRDTFHPRASAATLAESDSAPARALCDRADRPGSRLAWRVRRFLRSL